MPLKTNPADGPLVRKATVIVAEVLRAAIINGDLEAGERIKEDEVARTLDVSRTPVREALLLLASDGMLDMGTGRGSRARVREIDESELAVIYDVRALLEGYAAGRAASRISAADLLELEGSCSRMAEAPHDVRAYVLENMKFHSVILGAADTERLFFIVRRLLQIPMSYKAAFWSEKGARDLTLAGHRRIVAALRAGDADAAAAAMREHLMAVARARAAQASGKAVRRPSTRKPRSVAPSRPRAGRQ